MKIFRPVSLTVLTCSIILFLAGPGSTKWQSNYESAGATDYGNTAPWLSIPPVTKDEDVFYLYPTVYQRTISA
jgi:hypothetical protein